MCAGSVLRALQESEGSLRQFMATLRLMLLHFCRLMVNSWSLYRLMLLHSYFVASACFSSCSTAMARHSNCLSPSPGSFSLVEAAQCQSRARPRIRMLPCLQDRKCVRKPVCIMYNFKKVQANPWKGLNFNIERRTIPTAHTQKHASTSLKDLPVPVLRTTIPLSLLSNRLQHSICQLSFARRGLSVCLDTWETLLICKVFNSGAKVSTVVEARCAQMRVGRSQDMLNKMYL